MGMSPSAELTFCIPVDAQNEDTGDPTIWWDSENDDWRDLPEGLSYEFSGDFAYGETEAYVTITQAPSWTAYYDSTEVNPADMKVEPVLIVLADNSLAEFGAEERFRTHGGWYLIASYG